MSSAIRGSVPFGELVTVVCDEAANHSADPKEVFAIAARVVDRLLRRTPYRPSPRMCRPGGPSAGKEATCGSSSS
jgi:hypothetical protein